MQRTIPSIIPSASRVFGVLACVVVLWLVAVTGQASAHASLDSADPSPRSTLDVAPDVVTIRFTEPVAPEFSAVEVFAADGTQVDEGDSTVDSADAHVIRVSLRELGTGVYTVAWQNLSTVDGHSLAGSYVFGVGVTPGASEEPAEEPDVLYSPYGPVVRWLVLVGALVLFGGAVLSLVVAGPALATVAAAYRRWVEDRLAVSFCRLFLGAWVVLALGALFMLKVQVGLVSNGGFFGLDWGATSDLLTGTRWGNVWLWRAGGIVALAVPMIYLFRAGPGARWAMPAIMATGVLGAGVLLANSLTSHAAATGGLERELVITDFLHLLAVGAWIGALPHLALLVWSSMALPSPQRRTLLAVAVPRFSAIAVVCAVLALITGIVSSWAQVTSFSAISTPYGWTLVAKLGTIVPLLGVAAYNLLRLRPALATEDRAPSLRKLVFVEVAVAAVILGTVGVLTSLEPARQTASREADGITLSETVEGTAIEVTLDPGTTGSNRIVIDLSDRLGNPIANASTVNVRVSNVDKDLGSVESSAEPVGGGRYVIDDALFSLAGNWQIEVHVVRPDAFDARTAFRASVSSSGSGAIFPGQDVGRLLFGVQFGVIAVVLLAAGTSLGGWWRRRGVVVMSVGMLAGVVAIATIATNPLLSGGGETLTNPYPPDAASLAAGQAVYTENCAQCHGVGGLGDGPLAPTLTPPPANLIEHVLLHPDGDLFRFVSEGVDGTAMPSFAGTLSEEQIWHVVNYIKTLDGE